MNKIIAAAMQHTGLTTPRSFDGIVRPLTNKIAELRDFSKKCEDEADAIENEISLLRLRRDTLRTDAERADVLAGNLEGLLNV